ncbi:MAG: heparin-binding hemagglutinin [Nocardia sp.]|nr:heparin-binding hemagglutinin [Nocardia sp.]
MTQTSTATINNAAVTKPLYATVGAGDALYSAVNDLLDRVRDRSAIDSRVEEARERLSNLPADVREEVESLRERLSGLDVPDEIAELRDKLAPEELRRVVDDYYQELLDFYSDLAVRGEETVDRLRAKPAFGDRFDKVENLYNDVVDRTEDVLNKVRGKGEATDEAVVDAEVVEVTTEETAAPAAPAKKAPAKKAPAKKAPAKTTAAKKTTTSAKK